MRLSNYYSWVRTAVKRDDADEALERRAFGFAVGDVITLNPDHIKVQNPRDLTKVGYAIEWLRDPIAWAKTVSLRKPIDVSYRGGKFWVEDGYYRWTAARIRNKALRCRIVKIYDNPAFSLQSHRIRGMRIRSA